MGQKYNAFLLFLLLSRRFEERIDDFDETMLSSIRVFFNPLIPDSSSMEKIVCSPEYFSLCLFL